jgi:ABC-type transport system substrate-binding protein
MRSIRTKRDALWRSLALGAVGLAAGALAACPLGCGQTLAAPLPSARAADAPPVRGGTLRLASFTEMRNLDPAGTLDGLGLQAVHLLFAGLVDFDDGGRIVGDLAERWDVEDGGRTYRFVLREGVRMHDGEELTADDVKRSVERSLHPSAPNPAATFFENVRGYTDFAAKKAEHLDGVVVEGRYVVSFRLREPDAAFLSMVAMHTLRPVCRSGGERYVDTWLPCGAGPFKLEPGGWQRGSALRVVRHEAYYRAASTYLDAVEWTFNMQLVPQRFRFEDGDLDLLHDMVQADATRFAADPRWKALGAIGADTEVYGESMNTRLPPFDNVEIRRAVASAIDRRHYVMFKPMYMSPLTQLLPRGVPGFDPSFEGQRYDLDAALEHMKRAGFPFDPATGRGGWPAPIVYTVSDQTVNFSTAQLLQQDLAKIGLRLELRLVSWPAYLAVTWRQGASAMSPQGASLDYADPSNYFDQLFTTAAISAESSANTAFYSNPRFDDLVARAHREMDASVRNAMYREADRILCEDAPWAFTFGVHHFYVRQPYVRGFAPHPVWGLDASRIWLDRAAAAIERVLGGGLR